MKNTIENNMKFNSFEEAKEWCKKNINGFNDEEEVMVGSPNFFPQELYHYTDFDTLIKILDSGKVRFQMISKSDDPDEASFNFPIPLYCFCCGARENIELWNYYESIKKNVVCLKIKGPLIFSEKEVFDRYENFPYSGNGLAVCNMKSVNNVANGLMVPIQIRENEEILGPFYKNYIKNYSQHKFDNDDLFIKALFKEQEKWAFEEEIRYILIPQYMKQRENETTILKEMYCPPTPAELRGLLNGSTNFEYIQHKFQNPFQRVKETKLIAKKDIKDFIDIPYNSRFKKDLVIIYRERSLRSRLENLDVNSLMTNLGTKQP